MNNISQQTVGQIVADDYRVAQVFRAHGIGFCCGGDKSLENVCASKKINLDSILQEVINLKQSGPEQNNYNDWSLDFLSDYIVQNHHNFVRKVLPELNFYAHKVAKVHGERDPELLDILANVLELSAEISAHIERAESDLYPQIKELVQRNNTDSLKIDLVEVLAKENDKLDSIMANLEALTNGFNPPSNACASYRVLFQNLEGFQKDLQKHVHLENNILFPKALAFENRMN
ncbi:MAG: iron-sulfur cluster repair di-iron protein [Balneolaceae bacterium]